jgi:hypothetical protein
MPARVPYHPRRCSILVGIATKNYLVFSSGSSMPRNEAAPPSNPMRHGRIPNNKLPNPHTIAAREQFRTKPRCSPRRHRESQRSDRLEQKAAAADRVATSKNREGTAVALPDPISAAKVERKRSHFRPATRYWGVGLTLRAPRRTSLRRQRLASLTTTRTPLTQIIRS